MRIIVFLTPNLFLFLIKKKGKTSFIILVNILKRIVIEIIYNFRKSILHTISPLTVHHSLIHHSLYFISTGIDKFTH